MSYVLSEQPVQQTQFYQPVQGLLEIPAAGKWSGFVGAVVLFLAIGVGTAVLLARIAGSGTPERVREGA